jgi:hypothetical protein
MNSKNDIFFLVTTADNAAVSAQFRPTEFANITGMAGLDDAELENLHLYNCHDFKFVKLAKVSATLAKTLLINFASYLGMDVTPLQGMTAQTIHDKIILTKTKADMIAEINLITDDLINQMKKAYPETEASSWTQQLAEATAWTANNSSPTPLL